MPMGMGPERLSESSPFFRRLLWPALDQACLLQNSIHRAWRNCYYIPVKHHKCQSPVAFQRVIVMVFYNLLNLPLFKPEISWNVSIMFVDFTVALLPIPIFAGRKTDPAPKAVCWNLCSRNPVFYKVNDGITDVMGNPASF